jgi:hypothetical protein
MKEQVPSVVVFPNPGKGYFTIQQINGQPSSFEKIRVYDYQGKLIRNIDQVSLPLQIELNEAGFYLIELGSKGGLKHIKVVVTE